MKAYTVLKGHEIIEEMLRAQRDPDIDEEDEDWEDEIYDD